MIVLSGRAREVRVRVGEVVVRIELVAGRPKEYWEQRDLSNRAWLHDIRRYRVKIRSCTGVPKVDGG